MRSIIIAAGMGKRLRPFTDDEPKCLLKIAGKSIIERQLDIFNKLKITDIAVVRGYHKEKINFPDIAYYDNDDYQNNNILHSLCCAKLFMKGAFIASYSDIIYSQKTVKQLIDDPHDISIIVDVKWKKTYIRRTKHPIAEAELAAADKNLWITKIGKDVVIPPEALGEFIGLAKFSEKGAKIFVKEFNQLLKKYHADIKRPFQHAKEFQKAYFTDMFQYLVNKGYRVYAVPIEGGWREIDTDQDLERANRLYTKNKSAARKKGNYE